MHNYNIVFATNENYIQHLGVTLYSLLKQNSLLNFNIYIINGGIDRKKFDKVISIASSFNCKLDFISINDDIFEKLVTNHHFTKANYYRLLIPEFIDSDKALYLDCDIIINSSIIDLYNIDIEKYYVAAIEDPTYHWHQELKMDSDSRYFNSGVMLINIKKWNETHLHRNVINFIQENPQSIRFVDQCGLNAVINGNWKKIDLKYNLQSIAFEKEYEYFKNCFSKNELIEAIKNPVIIHYTGSSKPWQFHNKHPYKKLYWDNLKKTPFYHSQHIKYYSEILYSIPRILFMKVNRIIFFLIKENWK